MGSGVPPLTPECPKGLALWGHFPWPPLGTLVAVNTARSGLWERGR